MKITSRISPLLLLALSAGPLFPQTFSITTVAGDFPLPLSVATQVVADNPRAVAVDQSGTVYFIANNCVSKLNADGTLLRIAGRLPEYSSYSGDGGNATEAGLNSPSGLAIDATGNVYIADTGNNVIRKVTIDGIIQTIAGNGTAGYTGDSGAATNAELNQPTGVAVDSSGIVYIADTNNQRIRKVALSGTISTIAGTGNAGATGDEGPATAALVHNPAALTVDTAGNIYIAEFDRVRKISASGIIFTIAGPIPSPVAVAKGIAVDSSGNVYVANAPLNQIAKVATDGSVTTIAGTGTPGFTGDGGVATSAELYSPQSVAVDASGNVYIADQGNGRIRKITSGMISTIAGTGITSVTGGSSPAANSPNYGLAVDSAGNIYTADYNNNVVHKVVADGTASVIAGTGVAGFSGDGGQADNAELNHPTGLALDAAGNLYICDAGNHRIRKVAPNGIISTFAGSGPSGYTGDGGLAVNAELNAPLGLAVDSSGNVFFADEGDHVIRKITTGGAISTVAGTGVAGYSGDGSAAISATLNQPSDVAVDSSGNLFIADAGNGRLRKVINGVISTLATAASLSGVAVDSSGNAFITLPASGVIEKVTSSGNVTVVAGILGVVGFAGDGGPATAAQLNFPTGITIDASGHIYFSDTHNFSVRELILNGTNAVLTVSKSHTGSFTASQSNAQYTVVVSNAPGAGATTGTVTLVENTPPGLFLFSMSGNGWSCSSNTCTRSDALSGGSSYPPIVINTNVDANAPQQLANFVTLSGGGSSTTTDDDITNILPNAPPDSPVLLSPSNGAINVSSTPTLTWAAANGAASYDVFFGTGGTPSPIVTNQTSYSPGTLAAGTTYYWTVAAINGAGNAVTSVFSFTTSSSCSYSINPTAQPALVSAGTETLNLFTSQGCSWTATSNVPWLTITSGASGTGPGEIDYTAAANPYASSRTGTLTVGGQTFTVVQAGSTSPLQFIPVVPCRIADTRNANGAFGGPILSAGSTREFDIPASACNIPSAAVAYSLNATVVPTSTLNFLTLWTTGTPKPGVSTLNSDGRVKANAAVVVAGTNGGVNVFVTDATQFILDIDGYFVVKGTASALAFHPLAPCRIADTRQANGTLGGPALASGVPRSFPVMASTCAIPQTAQAYSLNFTAIPHGHLGFLTTWPTGQNQPNVSTLNASTGAVTANAAILPAGTNGAISLVASDATDVLIDINGYFDSNQSSGLSLYPIAPCRVADSRSPAGTPPFNGKVPLNISAGSCNVPSAQAYLTNATVVPTGSLGWLTLWADGQPQPGASTLNAYDGAITSNLAIVPSSNGTIDAFASNPTYAILDLLGTFNP